ncbi:MAG TPA: hypothetical protein VM513_08980 [Kofleriaceae bacterium]|jgi:hypothetical protein|nr:hypothetical protein [Kofleriaceae bacterium]
MRRAPAWPLGLWLVLGGSAIGWALLVVHAIRGAWLVLRETWRAW